MFYSSFRTLSMIAVFAYLPLVNELKIDYQSKNPMCKTFGLDILQFTNSSRIGIFRKVRSLEISMTLYCIR